MKILVAGAGGFIGGHLTHRLLEEGKEVTAVDVKPISHWHQRHVNAANFVADLAMRENCDQLLSGIDCVYNLAADMGGMGFIENNKSACMLNVLINTHLLQAAVKARTKNFFFAFSACVYSSVHQRAGLEVYSLSEDMAYPAMPEDGYGWEKLFSERMCRHFREDFGIDTRVARFHNVYGPKGSWRDGREKAPAAVCRKVAAAKLCGNREIEVWGDGKQVRSFLFVDDCIEAVQRLMRSEFADPINIGSAEAVTIDELVDIAAVHANVKITKKYNLSAPQGVAGRSSDNSLVNEILDWHPTVDIGQGIAKTYDWVEGELRDSRRNDAQ